MLELYTLIVDTCGLFVVCKSFVYLLGLIVIKEMYFNSNVYLRTYEIYTICNVVNSFVKSIAYIYFFFLFTFKLIDQFKYFFLFCFFPLVFVMMLFLFFDGLPGFFA